MTVFDGESLAKENLKFPLLTVEERIHEHFADRER
jgi:hypothetical protein